MSVSFAPIQRFYGLPRWRALTLPLIAAPYLLYTLDSAWGYQSRARRHVEGPGAGASGAAMARGNRNGKAMSAAVKQVEPAPATAEGFRSGKSGSDENFPVASLLIAAPLRPVILAFYDFVRAGDDVADHPDLAPAQKHALLDQLDRSLTGQGEAEPLGVRLARKTCRTGTDQPPRPRPARRLPPRRRQEPHRELGRADRLLPALGHAGRAFPARRPWREPRPVAGFRRHLRRAPDQQSFAGLRQGFPRPEPRLYSPGRARRGGRAGRGSGRGKSDAGPARLSARPRRQKPRAAGRGSEPAA